MPDHDSKSHAASSDHESRDRESPSADPQPSETLGPQQHELLGAIMQTAVDAIIVINRRGQISHLNPATAVMFGYDSEELIGQNVSLLMDQPDRDQHDGYLQHYQDTRQAKIIGVGREVTGRRHDGTLFPVHLAVSEIKTGSETYYAGIVRDISDLKQAQLELAESNRLLEQRVRERTEQLRQIEAQLARAERLAMLGEISGGIAHEVRNPLNAVRTSIYYLLNATQPTAQKQAEHLQRIDRQVTKIDKVIRTLTSIAKGPQPNSAACDLIELLDDVIDSITVPASISLEKRLDQPELIADVDANQMAIVFRNLLQNAIEAMPDGGQLVIETSAHPKHRMRLIDTGMGITAEDLLKITEPLFSTKSDGMGLGLSICMALLQKNNVDANITSEPGQGTCFELTFLNQGDDGR
ncbi:MAG: hypothetical protein CBB71_11185 [Rhodopirellula sp. TMED11]|nr:MAG: hypothetical protein CBB71_11185 [Rhodopirellula sp. TMED11]